jgi:hypothetical protein
VTLRTTRWSPDTCACVIEFTWDDAQSEDARTHAFDKAVIVCPQHAGIPDTDVYEAIVQENQAKNRALGYLLANAPASVTAQVLQPDGSTQTEWRTGMVPIWVMTGTRRTRQVQLTLPGWTQNQKNQAQAAADTRWPGRVVVL